MSSVMDPVHGLRAHDGVDRHMRCPSAVSLGFTGIQLAVGWVDNIGGWERLHWKILATSMHAHMMKLLEAIMLVAICT